MDMSSFEITAVVIICIVILAIAGGVVINVNVGDINIGKNRKNDNKN
jgi:hypothetical protein